MVLTTKDLYKVSESLVNDEDTVRIHNIGLSDLSGCAVHVLQKRCNKSKGFRSMFKVKDKHELWLYGKGGRIYYEILGLYEYHSKYGLKPVTDSVLRDWELTENSENYLRTVL